MTTPPPRRRRWLRRLLWAGLVLAALLVADWLAACWLLWGGYERLVGALREPVKALGSGQTCIQVHELDLMSSKERLIGGVEVLAYGDGFTVFLEREAITFRLERGSRTTFSSSKCRTGFEAERCDFGEARRAMTELADNLPRPGLFTRAVLSLVVRPLITGVWRADPLFHWRIWLPGGSAVVASDGWLREASSSLRWGKRRWRLALRRRPSEIEFIGPSGRAVKQVDIAATELDRGLAAAIRVLALRLQPVRKEPDRITREGRGWLEVKDGRRVLHLKGTPYEIGYQHGKLLAPNIKRMAERLVYGVGLLYSLEKGEWFVREAEKLVERQRPHIPPEYFEEMKGLAEGAGVPLALIQAANIFPEFFHCSGVALFGKATKGGTLLHARVLDYMTEVGLQDEAVLMAVEREGARRCVNVSYAGFIGSVTGMNEKQVAIGEMGGRGEGQWDGTPMSFLVRGALENCDTLEQALDYMRSRKRTCEYYYVISDGKSKSARGVAATSGQFEVIAPGQHHPRLPDPVGDA
ncbi:MAG: hypothetical protein FJ278_13815, partial [Planctomycetes bacterium]|nr:hypothetical protein [Planctomycetota bacterium]